MVLVFVMALGLAIAAANTWQRLGRTRRARAWSHSLNPDDQRNVLVSWPLCALACVLGGVVGLAPEGLVTYAAVPLFLLSMLGFLAYVLFPLPVPRFVQPRWYQHQAAGRDHSRG